jgi:hypothetical protein
MSTESGRTGDDEVTATAVDEWVTIQPGKAGNKANFPNVRISKVGDDTSSCRASLSRACLDEWGLIPEAVLVALHGTSVRVTPCDITHPQALKLASRASHLAKDGRVSNALFTATRVVDLLNIPVPSSYRATFENGSLYFDISEPLK